MSSKRYPSRFESRAGFFASTRDECLSPRVRLECNPEIPVAPGEEHWLLDTSLDEVYWTCSHSRAIPSFPTQLEWKITGTPGSSELGLQPWSQGPRECGPCTSTLWTPQPFVTVSDGAKCSWICPHSGLGPAWVSSVSRGLGRAGRDTCSLNESQRTQQGVSPCLWVTRGTGGFRSQPRHLLSPRPWSPPLVNGHK